MLSSLDDGIARASIKIGYNYRVVWYSMWYSINPNDGIHKQTLTNKNFVVKCTLCRSGWHRTAAGHSDFTFIHISHKATDSSTLADSLEPLLVGAHA